jgi:hypothetical protein
VGSRPACGTGVCRLVEWGPPRSVASACGTSTRVSVGFGTFPRQQVSARVEWADPLPFDTDRPTMTPPHVPVDNSIMVGSVAQSEQHVTLPGIDTVTRSKALRAPCWALVIGVQLLAGDGPVWRLLGLT